MYNFLEKKILGVQSITFFLVLFCVWKRRGEFFSFCLSCKGTRQNVANLLKILQILGPGMSTKMWEVTVDHARTCVLDKKNYVYYPIEYQQKKGVAFTIVGEVMGIFSDGQYISSVKLSETEKASCHIFLSFLHHLNFYFDLLNGGGAFNTSMCPILF